MRRNENDSGRDEGLNITMVLIDEEIYADKQDPVQCLLTKTRAHVCVHAKICHRTDKKRTQKIRVSYYNAVFHGT